MLAVTFPIGDERKNISLSTLEELKLKVRRRVLDDEDVLILEACIAFVSRNAPMFGTVSESQCEER